MLRRRDPIFWAASVHGFWLHSAATWQGHLVRG